MSGNDPSRYYELYWSEGGHRPLGFVYDDLVELLYPHVAPGARWVDVGCGDGRTAGTWLVRQGCDYIGFDISEAAVAEARGLGLDARRIDDAAALPIVDASVDGVVCLEVLEHLFDPLSAATEILRILRPGGVLAATVPNTAYWRRRLELALVGRWNPVGDDLSVSQPWRDPHIRFFTAGALHRMLTDVGFQDVEVSGHAGSFVRDIPWIGLRIWNGRVSRVYREAQRRLPGLFGLRLNAVARRPP